MNFKLIDFIMRVVFPISMFGLILYLMFTPLSGQTKIVNELIERGDCQQLDAFIRNEGIADKFPNAVDKCFSKVTEYKTHAR